MPSEFISPNERHVVTKIFNFHEILKAADLLPPDPAEYFEKPWKWGREHQAWADAGRPQPPDFISESTGRTPVDLSWQRFLRAVEELYSTH